MSKTKVICLTPIKNEAWILDRFLKCASLWADYIIIADQHSDDTSKEIARGYPKVILVDNPSPVYNESERQKLLIEAARQIAGQRLLITLDADEMLTANFMTSSEWNRIFNAAPGTVIEFQRANVLPGISSYWMDGINFPLGFMDDGSEYAGNVIHSPRIPVPGNAPRTLLRDIKLLHYQYTNMERMRAKHRWYQCWERINKPQKCSIDIYRQYHHMDSVPKNKIWPLSAEWLLGYEQKRIDMRSTCNEPLYWWDLETLSLLAKYGASTFKHEAIWDVDWPRLARSSNRSEEPSRYHDPRNIFDKCVHKWLNATLPFQGRIGIRLTDKVLRFLRW